MTALWTIVNSSLGGENYLGLLCLVEEDPEDEEESLNKTTYDNVRVWMVIGALATSFGLLSDMVNNQIACGKEMPAQNKVTSRLHFG